MYSCNQNVLTLFSVHGLGGDNRFSDEISCIHNPVTDLGLVLIDYHVSLIVGWMCITLKLKYSQLSRLVSRMPA